MADKNVIRKDVVQIDFDVDNSELTKMSKEIDDLKKTLTGGLDQGLDKAKDGLDDLKDGVKDVGNESKKSTAFIEKLKSGIGQLKDKIAATAKEASGKLYQGLKKAAGVSFKAIATGIGAVATGLGLVLKQSVTAYSDYEQLVGGVETLFKDSAGIVQKYANDAYKTAGLSANAYMENVTSFSASLLSSTGGDTAKAAEIANKAMIAMADNANKMGTPIENIQTAFQGFAKQQYMLLDNLKLGYGGTKTEMERLLQDAQKITGVKYNIDNLADVYTAIGVIQDKLDISGTTATEASTTIQGSLGMVKGAWENLQKAFVVGGEDLDQCIENMVESTLIFGKNVIPAIKKGLEGIGKAIPELAPVIAKELPSLIQDIVPPLIEGATVIVSELIKAIPTILPPLVAEVAKALYKGFTGKEVNGEMLNSITENTKKMIPVLKTAAIAVAGLVVAFKGFKAVNAIKGVFGSFGNGEKGGGSLFSGLTDTFKSLAKTDTTTILKGMANLAIIIGGFTAITAALVFITPYITQLGDMGSTLKLVALMGVVGLVGTGLAELGQTVGKIPVSTVALGLANMAIMIGGMSVLLAVVGLVSMIPFDTKRVFQISVIIGVLGTVGAALSVFAAIVGKIPIPIVLKGLANIGLVLGGMTALILAFGKLSETKGFDEFITKGGETLANLFNQIGKIAGSLIGGLGEGLTASLPAIGKNLADFATSIKPMFSAFAGADMAGIGSFFKSFGSFMLNMAGEGLASLITGGPDFAELGTNLSTFAEKSAGFFTKVATFPENGFKNAKLLFESLADISNVPNTGGVAQWFSGKNNYEDLANGLEKLSNDKVTNFFNKISTIPENGFKAAKKFFKALGDIGNIPNTGGIAQWFSGENDYEGLANGLETLSKEGVVKFFTVVSNLKNIGNIGKLFTNLKKIEDVTDLNVESLPNIGTKLTNFASNIEGFFNKMSGMSEKTSGVNSVINSLKNLMNTISTVTNTSMPTLKNGFSTTMSSISQIMSQKIAEIVKKVSDLPKKMGKGITDSSSSLSKALASVWKDAVVASISPVNKVIDGANWILKEFGSSKKIETWKPYANGTDGHKGGNALVNDGRGAELLQMPNGSMYIARGRNVFLPNAPKGMKVATAEQTAALMGRRAPTFNYADGTGNIDTWSYIDNPSGLVTKIKDGVSYGSAKGLGLSIAQGMVTTITGEMTAWIKKLFEENGGKSLASYVASKGVEQWRSTVIQALKMEGQYSEANVQRMLMQMQTESGGNPRAINLWDSNAKAGIPSKGLMQCIDPTFNAYARPGYNKNIYDPLSNCLAAIRYTMSRYGSLARGWQGHGYANGTGTMSIVRMPENSSTSSSSARYEDNSSYAPVFNLTINGNNDDRTMERKVKRWISEAMDEVFDSMARKNPRLREV